MVYPNPEIHTEALIYLCVCIYIYSTCIFEVNLGTRNLDNPEDQIQALFGEPITGFNHVNNCTQVQFKFLTVLMLGLHFLCKIPLRLEGNDI